MSGGPQQQPQRLIVGITGSSGAILGIQLLKALRSAGVESHLVVSAAARLTIEQETNWTVDEVCALADRVYGEGDVGAAIASGSFPARGMVVIPCSVKTLSAVANSYADNLVSRAADVTLKEGRPLVLVVREAPYHRGHIRLMKLAARAGAVIFPPVPAFYAGPNSVEDIAANIAGRVLGRLGIPGAAFHQWEGSGEGEEKGAPETVLKKMLSLPAMTLATVGKDGQPHAAALYFAADGENNLYFLSMDDGQHGADLAASGRAAVTIFPPAGDWHDIKGLQLRGSVRPVTSGAELEAAWRLYSAKFPFVEGLREVVDRNLFFVFRPEWVRVLDNSRGFGHKEEWKVG